MREHNGTYLLSLLLLIAAPTVCGAQRLSDAPAEDLPAPAAPRVDAPKAGALKADAQRVDGTAADSTRQPIRAERPIGFKIGLAGVSREDHLGVQADVIVLNRIGVELGTNIDITGLRARFYLLSGPSSPFAGVGSGIFYENGLPAGSWKELHVGFEHAFTNGLVLALQYTRIFDKRGPGSLSYTLTPAVGFRL